MVLTPLGNSKKFPTSLSESREEHRVYRSVTQEELPVLPPHPKRGLFPCFVGELNPAVLGEPQELVASTSRSRETRSCNHFKGTFMMTQCTPDTPDSALTSTVTPRTDSNTMAYVTALRRLERKPTIPMVNPDWKPDTAFWAREDSGLVLLHTRLGPDSSDTPEEPGDLCRPWRGNLRFWSNSRCGLSAPAMTSEVFRGPSLAWRDWTSEAPRACP